MTLSSWSRQAGQMIADDLGVHDAGIVFACQADIEDADGTSFGAQTNNPLNLRSRDGSGTPIPWEGMTGESPAGFAEFDTLEHGCQACAANYTNSEPYSSVRSALVASPFDPIALAQAIDASPWNEGGYGGRLVALVQSEIGGDMTPDEVKALIAEYGQSLETSELLPIKSRLDVLETAANKHTHDTTIPKPTL